MIIVVFIFWRDWRWDRVVRGIIIFLRFEVVSFFSVLLLGIREFFMFLVFFFVYRLLNVVFLRLSVVIV